MEFLDTVQETISSIDTQQEQGQEGQKAQASISVSTNVSSGSQLETSSSQASHATRPDNKKQSFDEIIEIFESDANASTLNDLYILFAQVSDESDPRYSYDDSQFRPALRRCQSESPSPRKHAKLEEEISPSEKELTKFLTVSFKDAFSWNSLHIAISPDALSTFLRRNISAGSIQQIHTYLQGIGCLDDSSITENEIIIINSVLKLQDWFNSVTFQIASCQYYHCCESANKGIRGFVSRLAKQGIDGCALQLLTSLCQLWNRDPTFELEPFSFQSAANQLTEVCIVMEAVRCFEDKIQDSNAKNRSFNEVIFCKSIELLTDSLGYDGELWKRKVQRQLKSYKDSTPQEIQRDLIQARNKLNETEIIPGIERWAMRKTATVWMKYHWIQYAEINAGKIVVAETTCKRHYAEGMKNDHNFMKNYCNFLMHLGREAVEQDDQDVDLILNNRKTAKDQLPPSLRDLVPGTDFLFRLILLLLRENSDQIQAEVALDNCPLEAHPVHSQQSKLLLARSKGVNLEPTYNKQFCSRLLRKPAMQDLNRLVSLVVAGPNLTKLLTRAEQCSEDPEIWMKQANKLALLS